MKEEQNGVTRLLSLHCAGPADLPALSLWCQRFTPLTASDPPDDVLLDITGRAHLFDGKTGLRAARRGADQGRHHLSYRNALDRQKVAQRVVPGADASQRLSTTAAKTRSAANGRN